MRSFVKKFSFYKILYYGEKYVGKRIKNRKGYKENFTTNHERREST